VVAWFAPSFVASARTGYSILPIQAVERKRTSNLLDLLALSAAPSVFQTTRISTWNSKRSPIRSGDTARDSISRVDESQVISQVFQVLQVLKDLTVKVEVRPPADLEDLGLVPYLPRCRTRRQCNYNHGMGAREISLPSSFLLLHADVKCVAGYPAHSERPAWTFAKTQNAFELKNMWRGLQHCSSDQALRPRGVFTNVVLSTQFVTEFPSLSSYGSRSQMRYYTYVGFSMPEKQ